MTSTKLVLRELQAEDESSFMAGVGDWEGQDLSWYTFVWKPGMSFSEHLEILDRHKRGVDLPEGFVPDTMLYGFVGDVIVGRLNIRHHLNEGLMKRGGHIGYAVSPKQRKKGYAKEMVKQGLPVCKSLGIEKLLVTCAVDNEPSWRIIESIGGAFESEVYDEIDKEHIKRYWVALE